MWPQIAVSLCLSVRGAVFEALVAVSLCLSVRGAVSEALVAVSLCLSLSEAKNENRETNTRTTKREAGITKRETNGIQTTKNETCRVSCFVFLVGSCAASVNAVPQNRDIHAAPL